MQIIYDNSNNLSDLTNKISSFTIYSNNTQLKISDGEKI